MDVSIIIPTYNRLWCLPAAIESCHNTKCATEIIIVDDGSTDGTWEWLTSQKGLIIYRQSHLGKCWGVNKAFAMATGKYVRFLDSDDMLDGQSIDEQFLLAEQNDSDIVVSGYKTIDNDESILKIQPWVDCDDFISQQLGECDGSHYAAFLFKKEFISDIPHRPDYSFRDDRMLILEAAIKDPSIAVHPGTALLHRVHRTDRLQFNSGIQQSVQNFQHLNIYRYILDQLKQKNLLTARRITAATNILWPLTKWIAKDNLDDAEKTAKWIYELKPDFKIPDKGIIGFLYRNLSYKRTEKILRLRRLLKYGWQ